MSDDQLSFLALADAAMAWTKHKFPTQCSVHIASPLSLVKGLYIEEGTHSPSKRQGNAKNNTEYLNIIIADTFYAAVWWILGLPQLPAMVAALVEVPQLLQVLH